MIQSNKFNDQIFCFHFMPGILLWHIVINNPLSVLNTVAHEVSLLGC